MDAVIINRISSQQQTDGFSLEAQEKHGKAYAKQKKFAVLKIWTFQETASKPEQRARFQEVLIFIDDYNKKNPKKKLVVVVEKPDRLYRNHQDKEWCQEKYLSGKAEFHFYKDNRIFNENSSPADVFMDDVFTSLNKYAAKNIGREALKGMREKAEQGWYPGKAPFGYRNSKIIEKGREIKIIVPHPDDAIIVKQIFEMRANGKSFEEIRKTIIASPLLPVNRANKFKHKSSVESIIKNVFYSGKFEWKGLVYHGKHELIVPSEVYEKVQNIDRRLTSRSGQKRGILSNWLTCDCGCKVTYDPKQKTIKTTGEKKTYHYYRCSNGKKSHQRYPYMTEDKIFEELGKSVDEIAIPEEMANAIADALNENQVKTSKARKRDLETYKIQLDKLEEKELDAYQDFKTGLLNEKLYHAQLERIANQRKELGKLVMLAQSQIDESYLVTAKKILELAKNAKMLWVTRSREEQRDFLEKILSNRVFDAPSMQYQLKKPFATLSQMASSSKMLRLLDSNQRQSGYFLT